MGTEMQVQGMAMDALREDVKDTIKHLENGAGRVENCPGHAWLAKGVVLCLRMLLTQINATQLSTRNHLAASGIASFVAVVVVQIITKVMEK